MIKQPNKTKCGHTITGGADKKQTGISIIIQVQFLTPTQQPGITALFLYICIYFTYFIVVIVLSVFKKVSMYVCMYTCDVFCIVVDSM